MWSMSMSGPGFPQMIQARSYPVGDDFMPAASSAIRLDGELRGNGDRQRQDCDIHPCHHPQWGWSQRHHRLRHPFGRYLAVALLDLDADGVAAQVLRGAESCAGAEERVEDGLGAEFADNIGQ